MELAYQPRDYQHQGVNDIYGAFSVYDRVIYQLPTRGGKGYILAKICMDALKWGKSVLILVDFGILFSGAADELDKHGIPYGTIKQGYDPQQITIASKDTYINREAIQFDLCIVDEAHKSLAPTFQQAITSNKVLGLTATPDGMDWYQTIIKGPPISLLQHRKILSEVLIYAPNQPDFSGVAVCNGDYNGEAIVAEIEKQKIVGDAISQYSQFADGKKGMVYCSTIAHSEKVAMEFTAAGIPAVSITSQDKDRDDKIADYYAGRYRLLVSVNMFLAGFTIKECECIIWLRPSQSITVWLQGNGRGMMYTGESLIVIDPVANVDRLGLVTEDHDWQLGKRIRVKRSEVMIRTCERCYKAFAPADTCPYCGHGVTVKRRAELKKIDGELKLREEESRKSRHKNFKVSVRACKTVDEAGRLAVECGYRYGYGYTYWTKCLRRGA